MTKLLNLDAIAPEEVREVQYQGKVYPIRDLTVDDFMAITAFAQALEGSSDVREHVKHTIDLIKRVCPDMEEATLWDMGLKRLNALALFIRGEAPKEIKEAAAAGN